jgi:phenylalanyl-tRNA synthetase alpha chain
MDLDKVQKQAIEKIRASQNNQELENYRIKYLGRHGLINSLTKKLSNYPRDQKSSAGKKLNQLKQALSQALDSQGEKITQQRLSRLEQKWFDVTAPGEKPKIGHLHPLTLVLDEIIDVFQGFGYQVAMGPEIETDEYNFEKLNFPPEHPARDAQATLYLDTAQTSLEPGSVILRTHTSAMQARIMEKTQPPFRVLVPGKCYRHDTVDASHGFEFWHVEGFVVEKEISMADLLGTLKTSLQLILGKKTKVRFACTYFPFVEPGVDTYVNCTLCGGKGCSYCKRTGWVEIMPAGMIHPNVFRAVGYDPEKTQGFAFAIGLSRVVNLKFGIDDLRLLTTADLRILKQF